MFLADQKETALNAVLIALYSAADHYAQSVELLENQPPADYFARLLHLRRAAATRLTELLRTLDFLPAEPDPDRLALTELATRVKAALAREVEPILVQKALHLEVQIEHRFEEALKMAMPPPVESTLQRLESETRREIERLQAQAKGSGE
jgi:hypothetical protein